MIKKNPVPLLLYFSPIIVFADFDAVNGFVNKIITYILNPFIFLLFAVATIVFVWGVAGFINGADNPEARSKGGQHMLWGILGFVIMVAAQALKTVIENTALKL